MNTPAKKYWFYLEPYVYAVSKNGKTLFYNTLDGVQLEVDNHDAAQLLADIQHADNLGVVDIDDSVLNGSNRQLLQTLRRHYMADWIEASSDEKPIQLTPILNQQRDITRLEKGRKDLIGENIQSYLRRLTIHVNQACAQGCRLCGSYAKQTLCCSTAEGGQGDELSPQLLESLLRQARKSVYNVNIAGGNILQHSQWDKLTQLLEPYEKWIHLWIHYANLANAPQPLPKGKHTYCIPVTFPVDKTTLDSCVERMNKEDATYYCLIASESEYEQAEALANGYGWKQYHTLPIWNGENIDFFRNNVFTSKNDIFEMPQSMRRIFIHQTVNTTFFGNLYVLPNGDVKANLNMEPLGNAHEHTLLKLMGKELTEGKAWRYVRDKEPCTECLYQHLCPSPSNYELAIGKPNLCRIQA